MVNCTTCKYHVENTGMIDKRTRKGMLKAGKEYCQNPGVKQKLISLREKGKFNYPTWCPLIDIKTCILCGAPIHQEEGEYCKNCR